MVLAVVRQFMEWFLLVAAVAVVELTLLVAV
jgi:hypothetical protein